MATSTSVDPSSAGRGVRSSPQLSSQKLQAAYPDVSAGATRVSFMRGSVWHTRRGAGPPGDRSGGPSGGRVPHDDDRLVVERSRAAGERLDSLEDQVGERPGGQRVVVRDDPLQPVDTEVLAARAG